MKYGKICKAEYIERPNRFVAVVRLPEGDTVRVHVKNTGRCRELLVPGAEVILEDFEGRMGKRKMRYSLIAVYKDDLLINMDSQAPNAAVREMLTEGSPKLPGLDYPLKVIRPETVYGDSRLDFYAEDAEGRRALIEVKGVTLEDKGTVRFPDAPTERGRKHLNELVRAAAEGYAAYAVFIVQMERAEQFEPNRMTDPDFAEALERAGDAGVKILVYTCSVREDEMTVSGSLPFVLR